MGSAADSLRISIFIPKDRNASTVALPKDGEPLYQRMLRSYNHTFPSGSQMTVKEYEVNATPNAVYGIKLITKTDWPAQDHAVSAEVIIDGVKQGMYLIRSNDRGSNLYLEGRRVSSDQVRCFRFKNLEIEDYKGNYKMPKRLAHDLPSWLNAKEEIGTIRVNIYEAKNARKSQRTWLGLEDYEPCTSIDEIGHIKLGEHIKCVTGFTPPKPCYKSPVYQSDNPPYPLHSLVVRYGTAGGKAKSNSANAETISSRNRGIKEATKKNKRSFRSLIARVFCFRSGESKPPAYEDVIDGGDEVPRYIEKSAL